MHSASIEITDAPCSLCTAVQLLNLNDTCKNWISF